MTSDDVCALLDAYRTGKNLEGGNSVRVRLVTHSEIEANGWDLNIGRYLKAGTVNIVDLPATLVNYETARRIRIESEHALFTRLTAAGITKPGGSHEATITNDDYNE